MIELIQLKKYYGTKALGLEGVSSVIKKGEVTGVIGENGSGKSTLLKLIMGLGEITSGRILVEGKEPSKMYDKMAFITEEGSFFPWMTASEYGFFLKDFYPEFDMREYKRLLGFFDVFNDVKIEDMSRGQRSKVEISAGFSRPAHYILMDEPFMGKDIFARQDFLKLMIAKLKVDKTIIISTHSINEIEKFLDRVLILQHGKLIADFYLEDIRTEGKNLKKVMMEVTGYDEHKYIELFE